MSLQSAVDSPARVYLVGQRKWDLPLLHDIGETHIAVASGGVNERVGTGSDDGVNARVVGGGVNALVGATGG